MNEEQALIFVTSLRALCNQHKVKLIVMAAAIENGDFLTMGTDEEMMNFVREKIGLCEGAVPSVSGSVPHSNDMN